MGYNFKELLVETFGHRRCLPEELLEMTKMK